MTLIKEIKNIVGFDTETSGTDVTNDFIVTASLVYESPTGEVKTKNWLLKPLREIPQEATNVHGVSTQEAEANGIDRKEALEDIIQTLATVISRDGIILAYNAAYDFSILKAEANREGIEPLDHKNRVADPMVLFKNEAKYRRGGHKLSSACEQYGVVLDNAHTSDADSLATVQVFKKMLTRHEWIGNSEINDLYNKTISLARAQKESLQEWLTKQGKPADVDMGWPIYDKVI